MKVPWSRRSTLPPNKNDGKILNLNPLLKLFANFFPWQWVYKISTYYIIPVVIVVG